MRVEQARTEKVDMSPHEAHSTGGDHTPQHVKRQKRRARVEGGMLEWLG